MIRVLFFIIYVCAAVVVSNAQSMYSIDPQSNVHAEDTDDVAVVASGNKAALTFATESVLKDGKWVKVRVKSTGIKKLSKATLAKMGFNDISKVSVYSNGGYKLPTVISFTRQDDLRQLRVMRTDDAVFFYVQDAKRWQYDATSQYFRCNVNEFDTYTYCYITDSKEPSPAPDLYEPTFPLNKTSNRCDYGVHYEPRLHNILHSGAQWYGDKILATNPSKTISFTLPPRQGADSVFVKCSLVGRSGGVIKYKVFFNDEILEKGEISSVNTSTTTGAYAKVVTFSEMVVTSDVSRNDVKITFEPNSTSDVVWIDYITLTSRGVMDTNGSSEYMLRSKDQSKTMYRLPYVDEVADGSMEFVVSGADASHVVWRVGYNVDPVNVPATFVDGKLHFTYDRGEINDFVVFNPKGTFEEPEVMGTVANQNLHGMPSVNYIIIYHPDFKEQAERLASLHRTYSGISVATVDVEHIYNEFSSGRFDPVALRDFIRCVYKKSLAGGDKLLNVLLFGDGSYDNMRRDDNKACKLPTYQSSESLVQSDSYVTDDFFGWLDDTDCASDLGSRMDVGIGRFPVQSVEEAKMAVDKSEMYMLNSDMGAWKNAVTVIADDGDECEHIQYAEVVSSLFESRYPDVNVRRIYMETYSPERTSTGIVYTKAHEDFMSSVNEGSLVLNYVGHGGYNALTDEGLFKQKDIKEWTNKSRLPFFVTATCDFCPFDKNEHFSAAEEGFLYPYGGFVGLFTTTRLVYGSSNNRINKAFTEFLLHTKDDGTRYTLGEASFNAKKKAGGLINSLKYVLIGDPALTLHYGTEHYVTTEVVNGDSIDVSETPISALRTNVISGAVRNADNSICETFNGQVMVTLYDKRVSKTMSGPVSGKAFTYEENGRVLFSGLANVTNGRFDVSFILSKDIDFEIGYGRVAYYAYSTDSIEASGSLNTILVGGVSESALDDNEGPKIDFWLDYPEFVDGSATGPNPIVYARIEDASGINVSGLGVGHNLSICIDNDRENAIDVNSFFVYDIGSFTSGTLVYQLQPLADGEHTIFIKAWDNLNNSSVKELTFVSNVHTGLSFGSIDLYPMPYIDKNNMTLSFSHNSGGGNLQLTMRLYGINGSLLSQRSFNVVSNGSTIDNIDLTDAVPTIKTLPSGLYFLEVNVEGNGRKGSFVKKIAVKAQ